MTREIKTKRIIFAFIALLLLIVTIIGGREILPAFAATTETNVLSDLQKDSSFKASDYPSIAKDNSIRVIQIAESSMGDVLVYTYQPSQSTKYLIATEINMSLNETVEGTQLYKLTLINSNGVFCKYRVNGIRVSSSQTRYYNITSIYRTWDKSIDKGTGNNNTIDKVPFKVGKIYKAETVNGNVKYTCELTYVVNIIDPYVDYLIYTKDEQIKFPTTSIIPNLTENLSIDSHYVAFSTDWEIDRLISADVSYYYCSGKATSSELLWFGFGDSVEYGASAPDKVTVKYTEKRTVEGSGPFWIKNRYEWNCIQTVEEMLASEEHLTEETKKNLEGKQWVLRFKETERTRKNTSVSVLYDHYECNFTKIDEVTILRLEFETDGVVYNLGAVGNVQSGDDLGGNEIKEEDKPSFWDWLWGKIKSAPYWVWLVIVVIALVILLPILITVFPVLVQILSAILKGIATVLKYLLLAVYWIISLPFNAIKAIKDKRNSKDDKGDKND